MRDICVGYAATPSEQTDWGGRNVWKVSWKKLARPHCDVGRDWTGGRTMIRFVGRRPRHCGFRANREPVMSMIFFCERS